MSSCPSALRSSSRLTFFLLFHINLDFLYSTFIFIQIGLTCDQSLSDRAKLQRTHPKTTYELISKLSHTERNTHT